jgi:hypothetical protein
MFGLDIVAKMVKPATRNPNITKEALKLKTAPSRTNTIVLSKVCGLSQAAAHDAIITKHVEIALNLFVGILRAWIKIAQRLFSLVKLLG